MKELSVIYGEQAAAVMVFASAEYAARDWTRHERRAALAGRLGVHATISAQVRRSSSPHSSLPRRSSGSAGAGPLPCGPGGHERAAAQVPPGRPVC